MITHNLTRLCYLCGAVVFIAYYCSCQTCVQDVCQMPTFCETNNTIADPHNCTKFFICLYFEWLSRDCPPGTNYDTVHCICKLPTDTRCFAETCPTEGPHVTVQPDLCDDVPEPCEDGKKYADISSCNHYFPCKNGAFEERTKCQIGEAYGVCDTPGYPCVFDIYGSQCIHPPGTFNCRYRCMTTLVASTQAMTTRMDEVTEEFTMGSITADYTDSYSNTADSTTMEHISMTKEAVTHEVTTTKESHTTETQGTTTLPDSSGSSGIIVGIVLAIGAILALLLIFAGLKYNRKKDIEDSDKDEVLEGPEVVSDTITLKEDTIAKFPGNTLLWRTDPVYLTERGLSVTSERNDSGLASFTAPYVENPLFALQESTDFFNNDEQESTDFFQGEQQDDTDLFQSEI